MSRMLRAAVTAVVAASVLALAGCAFGPEPGEVQARTTAVFDALAAELAAVDPAVVRTVEQDQVDALACGETDETQASLVARGTLSVRAEDGAAAGVVGTLADTLDPDAWTTVEGGDARAFTNDDGITVTLTDATPVVVVAVFGPCLPPVDVPAA